MKNIYYAFFATLLYCAMPLWSSAQNCQDPNAHNTGQPGACETCFDMVQNGDEEGVDCGGSNPNCVECPPEPPQVSLDIAGNFYFRNKSLISSIGLNSNGDVVPSNIDHIWHDDTDNIWHFVSDGEERAEGNSRLKMGTLDVDYLFPSLGANEPYRFIRFGQPNEYYAGLMWNNNFSESLNFGDGNDFALFTYEDRDIYINPGGGKTVFMNNGDERMRIDADGNVGIGKTPSFSKLDVDANGNTSAGIFTNRAGGTNYGIRVFNNATGGNVTNTIQYGVYSKTEGLGTGYGVYGRAEAGVTAQTVYGVYGYAFTGNGIKYGVYGRSNAVSGTQYGVYGTTEGFGTRYAGYFNGNVAYTGTITDVSDRKFKKQIKNADSQLEKILQLKPKTYLFNNNYKFINFAEGKQFGFIAQEMQEVFPELVTNNVHAHHDEETQESTEVEYLGINYVHLIPVLTKAIQEQQEIIEEKEKRLQSAEAQIADLQEQLKQLTTTVQQLVNNNQTIGEQSGIVNPLPRLQQNQPNPFTENTSIHYFVPETAQRAQLQITTLDGKVLKTFALTKGENRLTIDARQLASGSYFYTLSVDGQTVETKQMVLTDY